VDDQSWKTDYICLNMPEPVRLADMEAVEKHFRETHKENIIKPVETHALNGAAARALRSPELARLVRSVCEDQRRFPLQLATVLSQQFAGHGLQFFKVNKTLTHVCVARPRYLDLTATPVSEGVRRIVEYINATPKCTRRQLVEALAPSPPAPVVPSAGADAPKAESAEPTPEQTAVIADLHWLIHEGHVIEFATGILETAKKPLPKPEPRITPKPAQAAPPTEAAAAAAVEAQAASTEPHPEAAPVPSAEPPQPATVQTTEPSLAITSQAAAPEAAPDEPRPATPVEPSESPPAGPVESPS